MTYAHSIDNTFHLNGHDPREMLAALSGSFHEVPERSIIVTATDSSGALSALARVRFADEPMFSALRTASALILESAHSGAERIIVAVVGDISETVSPTVAPPSEGVLSPAGARKIAEWLLEMAVGPGEGPSVVAYVFAADTAAIALVDGFPELEWCEHSVGNIHTSVYATEKVANGETYSLTAGPRHFVSAEASEFLQKRWRARSMPSHAQVPLKEDAASLSRGKSLVRALLDAGAGDEGWLASSDADEIATKCELLEELLTFANSRAGRDIILRHTVDLSVAGIRPEADPMELLLNPCIRPEIATVSPGGRTYYLARLPEAILRQCPKIGDLALAQGLIHLSCNYALMAWWSGRFAQAHSAAKIVLARDPLNEMATYVAQMTEEGIVPPWLEREQLMARLEMSQGHRNWAA